MVAILPNILYNVKHDIKGVGEKYGGESKKKNE
nr:MAG TPA: hypothetical protein [Caudoviricetes sp.]